MSADHSFMPDLLHTPNHRYIEDGYNSPIPGSPRDASIPRSVRFPLPHRPFLGNMMTTANSMIGSPGRPTHMNTPTVAGNHPMSSVAYGFRPEAGCAGVLFQIFLQGSLVANWQTQKEPLEFWVSFEALSVPAVLHDVDSSVSLPDIGTKRYVLQSIVPPAQNGRPDRRCPITLSINGPGGRSIARGLFIGNFQYRPNDGSLKVYEYRGNHNALFRWLKEDAPRNMDTLTPVNEGELCDIGSQNIFDISNRTEDSSVQQFQYPPQSEDDQFQNDIQSQLRQTHVASGLIHREPQYDEDTLYDQYYPSQESLTTTHQHLDLLYRHHSDMEIQERPAPIYHLRSDPQQYTLSQIGMSHSEHNSSPFYGPRPVASPMTRRIPGGRPVQGYGKLTFLHRPDMLGDFNTWSLQEQQDNRRIVAFNKEIRGEVIQLDCYPIAAHEYDENMITISCIRWIPSPPHESGHKLMGECVFTSVDIIVLLEKLVGYSFDVQEKNRIRRNLEGYKPVTVGKEGKTRQFFNQVMLYAQPKARNIEKDIKVFLWRDLAKALKKVVQKYSKRMESANVENTSGEPEISLSSSLSNSQPSSTDSLPTERTFMAGNNPGVDDYHSNSDFPAPSVEHHAMVEWHSMIGSLAYSMPSSSEIESAAIGDSQMYYSQDENGGDTSSVSISPTGQMTPLGRVDYVQMMDGSVGSDQEALDAYIHDIPGDYVLQ